MNYFNPYFYTLNFNQGLPEYERIPKANGPRISKMNTKSYTFSVDIDAIGDIHDHTVKQAVEDLAQFHADEFRKYAPNSVYILFSGGGVYVHVHHKVFQEYFNNLGYPYDESVQSLLTGFGGWLDDISKRFFLKYPQHEGKAKADSLNDAKRIFKTIFSLHNSKPYAVIPLDPDNIKINFDKAKLPLKEDVLDAGDRWYRDYDMDGKMLDEAIRYSEQAKIKHPKREYDDSIGYERSEVPISVEEWPPCMQNLIKLEHGTTRARAVICAFMGQMGIPEQEAYNIFLDLSTRWNQHTTNVFESNYRVLRTPYCKTLNSDDNSGYPHGRSLKNLDICKADIGCINCGSPRYYADKQANIERLRWKLTGTAPKKEEHPNTPDPVHTPKIQYSLIRINKDVSVFAGADGRSYNLNAHDVATIPSVNALALIKRKVAVEINQGVPA